MRAGRMRHRVAFEREATDADGSPSVSDGRGGRRLEWINVLSTPDGKWAAEVRPLTVREQSFAAQVQASTSHLIRCRHHSAITAATRAVLGTRVFNIVGVRTIDEVRHEMVLDCEEGKAP